MKDSASLTNPVPRVLWLYDERVRNSRSVANRTLRAKMHFQHDLIIIKEYYRSFLYPILVMGDNINWPRFQGLLSLFYIGTSLEIKETTSVRDEVECQCRSKYLFPLGSDSNKHWERSCHTLNVLLWWDIQGTYKNYKTVIKNRLTILKGWFYVVVFFCIVGKMIVKINFVFNARFATLFPGLLFCFWLIVIDYEKEKYKS